MMAVSLVCVSYCGTKCFHLKMHQNDLFFPDFVFQF